MLALADRLNELKIDGVVEAVPTIRSLSVYYEPLHISAKQLESRIADVFGRMNHVGIAGRTCAIPVCYDPDVAPDLKDVASRCSLSPSAVIELHSSQTYHVYMLGFLPGLAYLGDLPQELALPRRDTPRSRISAGSLGIGGKLTCIYPMATACGWHLIGHSPVPLWDSAGGTGALLHPGDKVKLNPVSLREYRRLCASGDMTAPHACHWH